MMRDAHARVLEGRSLLARGVSMLRTLFPSVSVSLVPEQPSDLGDSGAPPLLDAYSPSSSLTSVITALERFSAPVFVSSVDLAFPDAHAARRVVNELGDADVCLPLTSTGLVPTFAAYRPSCLPSLRNLLACGEQQITSCFSDLTVNTVTFDEPSQFLRIRTPANLAAVQTTLTGGTRNRQPALVAIVGKSDSGKTTLVERLLPELRRLGVRAGTVKHDAHSFEIDHPGKDSYRHGAAGAAAYVVSSPKRVAYIAAVEHELSLGELTRRFFTDVDVVLAEGYKRTAPHRVEVFRRGAGHREPLCNPDECLAVVTDAPLNYPIRFGLDDAADLATFLTLRLDSLRAY